LCGKTLIIQILAIKPQMADSAFHNPYRDPHKVYIPSRSQHYWHKEYYWQI